MLKSLISKGLTVPHRCENRYKNNLLSPVSYLLSPLSRLLSPIENNECFINTDVDSSCIECRRMDSGNLVSLDL